MQLDINTEKLDEFSRKLKTISRSALPVSVRETLNDCAKDMKTNTLMKSSSDAFINRSQNFFKANSSYDRATGFDIGSMKATVGMTEDSLKGNPAKSNYAVKDLEQQEGGGNIQKKTLIPMKEARKGRNPNQLVRPNARLQAIKHAINSRNVKGVNKAQRFLLAAMKAGKGGFVIGSALNGENMLWKINSVFSSLKNKGLVVKAVPLYDVVKNRSVHVKATHFVEKAGNETHRKIDNYFIDRAERAFEKHLR